MPSSVRALIEEKSTSISLSVVSVWEIATKYSLGRPRTAHTPERLIERVGDELGASVVDIRLVHAVESAKLPWHHNDPFDRLLIAQSIVENIPILTADPAIAKYSVRVVW